MKYFIYSILIIFLGAGFLFSESFLDKSKFELSASMTGAFDYFKGNSDLKARIQELEKENENLRVEVFNDKVSLPDTVKVYSVYPFNNIKEIIIAGGEVIVQKRD